jgi:hypothetical protein
VTAPPGAETFEEVSAMKYLLIHAVDDRVTPDQENGETPSELSAWVEEMTARGVLLDGARLRPVSDATSVRVANGRAEVTDGPFAETKEQVAGYDVVDCADLDAAIAVASAHPTTYAGSIEVRRFAEGMPDPEVPDEPADGRVRYLMLVCADMRHTEERAEMPSPEIADPPPSEDGPDEVDDWIAGLGDRRLYGWPLQSPEEAVTVRRVDRRVVTTDGPFAETKEQIAGYDLLECRDLDEALEAAAAHPVAGVGVIEVRPVWR